MLFRFDHSLGDVDPSHVLDGVRQAVHDIHDLPRHLPRPHWAVSRGNHRDLLHLGDGAADLRRHPGHDLHHHVQGPGCALQSSIACKAICNNCQPLDGGLAQPLVVVGVWPTEQEEGVGGVNLLLGRIALYAPRARAFKLQRKRGVPGQLYYLDSM